MASRGNFGKLVDPFLEYEGIASTSFPEGKTYKVPNPDIASGLKLAALGQVAQMSNSGVEVDPEEMKALTPDVDGIEGLQRMTLGPVYDEMVADGVPWPAFRYVFGDAFTFFAVSPELANLLRERLGEALAPASPEPSTSSQQPTPPSTGGSSSSPASTGTGDQTQTATLGPSSTETQLSETPAAE